MFSGVSSSSSSTTTALGYSKVVMDIETSHNHETPEVISSSSTTNMKMKDVDQGELEEQVSLVSGIPSNNVTMTTTTNNMNTSNDSVGDSVVQRKKNGNVIPARIVNYPGPYDYPERPMARYTVSSGVCKPPFYKRKVGRMYVCWERYRKDDDSIDLLCMMGPCWPMYFVTLTLIVGLSLAAFIPFLPVLPVWVGVIAWILLITVVVAFTCTACGNPGILERSQESLGPLYVYDELAQCYRPDQSIYEQESQTIIYDVDHFCPWTGTVIAQKNMTAFTVFTSMLCVLVIFVLVIVVWGVALTAPTKRNIRGLMTGDWEISPQEVDEMLLF